MDSLFKIRIITCVFSLVVAHFAEAQGVPPAPWPAFYNSPPNCMMWANPAGAGCFQPPPWFASAWNRAPLDMRMQAWQIASPPLYDFLQNPGFINPTFIETSDEDSSTRENDIDHIYRDIAREGQRNYTVEQGANKVAELNHKNCFCEVPKGAAATLNSNPSQQCQIQKINTIPGSHKLGSDSIVSMTTDPKDPNLVYAVTFDNAVDVPQAQKGLFVSKSSDGGRTWTRIAQVPSKDLDDSLSEGMRNRISVAQDPKSGHNVYVITTQKGAFQFSDSGSGDAAFTQLDGPTIQHPKPPRENERMKVAGDATAGGDTKVSADGKHMIVNFDESTETPQVWTYHLENGKWVKDNSYVLPKQKFNTSHIYSLAFDPADSSKIIVGTGQMVLKLNSKTKDWSRVPGVLGDSNVESISTEGGLHFTTCHGTYIPDKKGGVVTAKSSEFIFPKATNGANLRGYHIEVNPFDPTHQQMVVTSSTGVYTSKDGGQKWNRISDPALPQCQSQTGSVDPKTCAEYLNDLRKPGKSTSNPEFPHLLPQEYRTAHFNKDGSIILSGPSGTYLSHPFSASCSK